MHKQTPSRLRSQQSIFQYPTVRDHLLEYLGHSDSGSYVLKLRHRRYRAHGLSVSDAVAARGGRWRKASPD